MPRGVQLPPLGPPPTFALPNPPPVFCGRTEALSWIAAALARAPVAAIAGLGGMGKTALALTAAAKIVTGDLPGQRRPARFVPCASLSPEDVLERVLRALLGLEPELSEVAAEPASTLGQTAAVARHFADRHRALVILDNVSDETLEGLEPALTQWLTYGRQGQWLVTSRSRPTCDALSPQVRVLGGLSVTELAEVAGALAPTLSYDQRRTFAANAQGSPARLRQALAGRTPEDDSDTLGETAREVVDTLARFEEFLPEDAVRAMVPVASAEVLAELTRAAIIERAGGGVRVHDAVRPLANRRPHEDTRIAEALAARPETVCRIESVRLHAASGDWHAVEHMLGTGLDDLVRDGWSRRLFRAIRHAPPAPSISFGSGSPRRWGRGGCSRKSSSPKEPPTTRSCSSRRRAWRPETSRARRTSFASSRTAGQILRLDGGPRACRHFAR